MTRPPLRGEIWRVNLDPVIRHEQGRVRPALVVSNNIINASRGGMVTVVPITTKFRPVRSFLKVMPPEAGLTQISYVICDQVRTISVDRLGKRFGILSGPIVAEVARRLMFLLDLP